jgi:putative oxidoreductase
MIVFNIAMAILFCRILLGILFVMQGIDKAFNIKLHGVVDAYRFQESGAQSHMPSLLLYIGAAYTTYVELIAGVLLIAGLFTSYALYFLGVDLIIVSIGIGIRQPLWDMKYVFPRLAILVFLLLTPADWNTISLDHFLGLIK